MENTEELAVQITPEVVYQQDKATIDVQISTAKAYPRNIRRATENAIAIVSIDKDTAATCTYSVPRGGKSIPAHPFTSRRFSLKFGEPAN